MVRGGRAPSPEEVLGPWHPPPGLPSSSSRCWTRSRVRRQRALGFGVQEGSENRGLFSSWGQRHFFPDSSVALTPKVSESGSGREVIAVGFHSAGSGSQRGQCCSLLRVQGDAWLDTFLAVTAQGRCYWHPEGRSQGCRSTSHNAQDGPHNKTPFAQSPRSLTLT